MTVGWLDTLTDRLGTPEHDYEGVMNRWTWQDGDYGILMDRLTTVWQIVAWTPVRSVTVRSVALPDDRDCSTVVILAGLDVHGSAAP